MLDQRLLWRLVVPERRSGDRDRRRTTLSGRRQADPKPDVAGVRVKTSATLVWELPDETRCWIMRHRGKVIAHVSRGLQDLRLEIFDSQVTAQSHAELWRLEFDVDIVVGGEPERSA